MIKSFQHTNRHVRETGYSICKQIFSISDPQLLESEVAPKFAPNLIFGLDDNWSEVRYSASVATRELLLKAGPYKENYYPFLIQRMVSFFFFDFFNFFLLKK